MTTSSRAQAAAILGRVLRSGAYSNVLLGQLGGGADARLIRRLVYGTLRQLDAVDAVLAQASNRRLRDIESAVLDILRIGTWELRFGDGAAHAAVDEAVSAAASTKGRRAGGFVNAVLRAVQAGAGVPLTPGQSLGVADWILERLTAAWGSDESTAFLEASLAAAPRTVRVRPGATGGVPIAGIAGAAAVDEVGDGMVVMDPSSVAVGVAAGVVPGMSVLDMAAAPGGKTLHLYDELSDQAGEIDGLLIASDRHQRRAASARKRILALGADVPWVVADGRQLPFPSHSFDRVLLDAPCTGLGTLRGRPEVRHRLKPDSPRRAGALQARLLDEARRVIRPDGFVVYAVCTVFPEETIDVVEGLPAGAPDGLPGRAFGKGWLLGPHLSGSDGMFISLVRA